MPLPLLIHPVDIVIETLSTQTTVYDDDFREAIQQAERGVAVTVPGQVKWADEEGMTVTRGGIQQSANGYVLFRYVDLQGLSIELRENDRIISMGHVQTNVYIVGTTPMGHYGDQNGPALIKAHFADRAPSRGGA